MIANTQKNQYFKFFLQVVDFKPKSSQEFLIHCISKITHEGGM